MRFIADKNPPEPITRQEHILDFSGGQISSVSSVLLKNKEAQKAINTDFSIRGILKLRPGHKHRYSNPLAYTNILGLGHLYKTDGTTRLVIAVADKLYYDKPHMERRFDTQDDWKTGVLTYLDADTKEGSLLYDATGAPVDIVKEIKTNADFDTGDYTHYTKAENDTLVAELPPPLTITKSKSSDFLGTRNNVDIRSGVVSLHGELTFEPYKTWTFNQLIAL